MDAPQSNIEDVVEEVSPPPAALARRVDDGRRRELARALHEPKRCAPAIAERLEHMRGLLAKYRAEAIALHARLVALELAGNDNVAPLRRALIASTAQIESLSKLIECDKEPRLARGTEPLDEWIDQPTLRR
jgi:hypothetical protein